MDRKRTDSRLDSRSEPNGQASSPPEPAAPAELNSYQLDCLACSYARIVDGIQPALETSIEHEEKHGDDHFVELELLED
ncbi:hypothetical protein [Halegenticoccus soli]|uniref:hypothetical protein n=1 Tax=Halegenticoccus soli TaxID=1985678 RepID=UPI000C6D9B6D|nr:hypothetical protein [Halegenticoccus soli]